MRKQTNTLSPSPKSFQSPSPRTSEKSADSDSDVRKALVVTTYSAIVICIDIVIRVDELGIQGCKH
jgi:hypothetical protein